jgi:hypothetical protein
LSVKSCTQKILANQIVTHTYGWVEHLLKIL